MSDKAASLQTDAFNHIAFGKYTQRRVCFHFVETDTRSVHDFQQLCMAGCYCLCSLVSSFDTIR